MSTETVASSPRPALAGALPDMRSRSLVGQRVMVTGGAGFIGSHVVERLVSAGANVRVLDDLSSGQLRYLATARQSGWQASDFIEKDIRSGDAAVSLAEWRPRLLVHLAAQVSVPNAVRLPVDDADVNIRGTLNLLDAASAAGVETVVFAASCAMYGQVDVDQLPIRESQALAPGTPYAMSKAAAVGYLDWYRRHRGLNYTALALGNVYGPRQDGRGCGVVARFLSDLRQGRAPMVFGDGHQTRDFVHVADVADAFFKACTSPPAGIVNVASGVETSVLQIRDLIGSATGSRLATRHADPIPGEPTRVALSTERAQMALGWAPTIPLSVGIRRMVEDRQP